MGGGGGGGYLGDAIHGGGLRDNSVGGVVFGGSGAEHDDGRRGRAVERVSERSKGG